MNNMAFDYNFKSTETAKDGGKFLAPGIHNATFKGVTLDKVTSQKDGTTYNTMKLTLDIEDYGEYSHNFFEPTSDQRTQSQFGENPSQVEQFMIVVRQILEALCPETLKKIYASEKGLGKSFTEIVTNVGKATKDCIGMETQVKLIPNGNYNQIPGFPARIDKNGNLGIATRFIGKDLVLSAAELKKVNAAQNAKPTNMAQSQETKDLLNDIASDLDSDNTDDLPF